MIPLVARLLGRLRADRRGNVLMLLGFALIPMTFATGMTIDYARAARIQTRLNAITDAAALAGVTPTALSLSRSSDAAAVVKMWYAQAGVAQCSGATVNRVTYNNCAMPKVGASDDGATYQSYDGTLTLKIADTNTTGLNRTVTMSYTATSNNVFGTLLNMVGIQIGGTTTTASKTAPNIDFYMMLDVSSSMALPTTSSGISTMKTLNGNCAFACHMTNPKAYTDDHPGDAVVYANGQQIDYYTLAHNNNVELRIDSAKTAVQGVIDRASSTMKTNNANYRFSVSSFARAASFANLAKVTDSLATARSQTGTVQAVSVTYKDTDWDRWTEYDGSITKAGNLMPANSGTGTNKPGDTPQSILFIVTDGMHDEQVNGNRVMGAISQTMCNAIKQRQNTRIAVLYTTYDPISIAGDSWSQANAAPLLPSLSPALQSCASPGLFFQVSTDGDIPGALDSLFDKVVATAHITQ